MVQRKVPNKLGIQADHVKSEKRLGNLKSTSCQHLDGKSRGPDMKKKMKRSRSIKLSDIESLNSSPSRKPVLQPGKPPPLRAPATPQKQPMIKAADSSPNYMKATSSSAAREERSPVSSLNTQPGSNSKIMRRRNSNNPKLSSASTNKPTKTLTKTSSFKLARTLTKTPSFKPVRGTTKKCARVALCAAEMNAQKATCSSTLKDSNFPAYLMLTPGSTEAEGTSVMKVCPYTYCSLNGHYHTPLPPLKCFLKARRRSLKTQKSMKFEVLSPRGAKPSGAETEEIDDRLLGLAGDKRPREEEVLVDSVPILKEDSKNFFIEIFATKYFTAGTEKGTEEGEMGTVDSAEEQGEQNNESSFDGDDEAGAGVDNIEHVSEILSHSSTHSEIDFEENFRQYTDTNSEEMDITVDFLEENKVDVDAAYSTIFAEAETIAQSTGSGSQIEGESCVSIEDNDNISEAADMDWEEGQFFVSEIDAEAYYLKKTDDESSANDKCIFEIKKANLKEEPDIISSDDIVSTFTEEILADEVQQELSEETAYGLKCNGDFEMDVMPNDKQIIPSSQLTGGLTYDPLASTEDTSQVPKTMGENGEETENVIGIVMKFALIGEPATESEEASGNSQEDEVCETEKSIFQANPQPGDAESDCLTDMTGEALNAHQEDRCLQPDDTTITLQNKITDPCQNSVAICELETNEDHNKSLQSKDTDNDEKVTVTVSSIDQEALIGEAGDATENQEQVADAKLSFEVSDSSPSLSEADQDDSGTNNDKQYIRRITTAESQLNEIAEESESSQDHFDDSGLVEPHNHRLDGQSGSIIVVEIQDSMEEDQDQANKFKVPTLTDSEEHSDPKLYKISSAGFDPMEDETLEVEACAKSDTAEACLTAKHGIRPGSECALLHSVRNSMPETFNGCNYRKWAIGCKKPIKDDLEEQREFNPREPNFLPPVPDPEAEKVDLRHQMVDDRKNSEEWMLDFALQRAVTKLAPARKRKVALLVEAFETVLPIPKLQPHIRHSSAAFSHARPVQACN